MPIGPLLAAAPNPASVSDAVEITRRRDPTSSRRSAESPETMARQATTNEEVCAMHGTSRSTSATLILTLALALMACAEGAADEPRHKAAGVGIGMAPCPTPAEIETAKLAFTFTVNGSDRFEAGTGLPMCRGARRSISRTARPMTSRATSPPTTLPTTSGSTRPGSTTTVPWALAARTPAGATRLVATAAVTGTTPGRSTTWTSIPAARSTSRSGCARGRAASCTSRSKGA